MQFTELDSILSELLSLKVVLSLILYGPLSFVLGEVRIQEFIANLGIASPHMFGRTRLLKKS